MTIEFADSTTQKASSIFFREGGRKTVRREIIFPAFSPFSQKKGYLRQSCNPSSNCWLRKEPMGAVFCKSSWNLDISFVDTFILLPNR
jgi:hypothetical protein